jgi:hypothetical protein
MKRWLLRSLAVTPCLMSLLGTTARAATADPSTEPATTRPAGTFYAGLGLNAIAAKSLGGGYSLELGLEIERWLFEAELLSATGVHGYGTLLAQAGIGRVLVDANRAPYVLGGIGYLLRGDLVFDEPSSSEREDVVATLEAGYVFGRDRRWGQIWAGARLLIPLATPVKVSPLPDFPWGMIVVRFLL